MSSATPTTTTSQPALAGAGAATGESATHEAVSQALSALEHAAFVLVFPSAQLDAREVAAQAASAAGDVPVVGMAARAELASTGPTLGGCTAMALGGAISHGVGVAGEASTDFRAAGHAAATAAVGGGGPRPPPPQHQ
jgi:hypothetical protein